MQSEYANTNPEIWGPSFWLSLHNGAAKFPLMASPIYQKRMKGFILGIPYMLPCDECRNHALAWIDFHVDDLDEICSGREKLFNFFVDFHNQVNKRKGKPILSYQEAWEIYSTPIEITFMYK